MNNLCINRSSWLLYRKKKLRVSFMLKFGRIRILFFEGRILSQTAFFISGSGSIPPGSTTLVVTRWGLCEHQYPSTTAHTWSAWRIFIGRGIADFLLPLKYLHTIARNWICTLMKEELWTEQEDFYYELHQNFCLSKYSGKCLAFKIEIFVHTSIGFVEAL